MTPPDSEGPSELLKLEPEPILSRILSMVCTLASGNCWRLARLPPNRLGMSFGFCGFPAEWASKLSCDVADASLPLSLSSQHSMCFFFWDLE